MRITLPSPEYAEDVRVCDFCFAHLAQGDKNSILRYLGVLRSSEVDCVDKLNAARALHMSLEFEPLAPDATYPALYTAVRQFGGFHALWQIIKCITDDASSPSELKDLMCRLVSSAFARLSPRDLESAKMFYYLDGVSMLVRCLQDADCVESASEALTHVVSKVGYRMEKMRSPRVKLFPPAVSLLHVLPPPAHLPILNARTWMACSCRPLSASPPCSSRYCTQVLLHANDILALTAL